MYRQCAEKNNNWNGGRVIKNGYIFVRCENHPKKMMPGHYVREHDILMEKRIGRYLRENEIVHHKNFDGLDNRLSNLLLMTNSEHCSLHNHNRIHTKTSRLKHAKKASLMVRDKFGRFVKNLEED